MINTGAMKALRKLDSDPRFNETRLIGRMLARLNQIMLGTVDKSAFKDIEALLLAGGFTKTEIDRFAEVAMVLNKEFHAAGGNGPTAGGGLN